jgi:hypothetical protein
LQLGERKGERRSQEPSDNFFIHPSQQPPLSMDAREWSDVKYALRRSESHDGPRLPDIQETFKLKLEQKRKEKREKIRESLGSVCQQIDGVDRWLQSVLDMRSRCADAVTLLDSAYSGSINRMNQATALRSESQTYQRYCNRLADVRKFLGYLQVIDDACNGESILLAPLAISECYLWIQQHQSRVKETTEVEPGEMQHFLNLSRLFEENNRMAEKEKSSRNVLETLLLPTSADVWLGQCATALQDVSSKWKRRLRSWCESIFTVNEDEGAVLIRESVSVEEGSSKRVPAWLVILAGGNLWFNYCERLIPMKLSADGFSSSLAAEDGFLSSNDNDASLFSAAWTLNTTGPQLQHVPGEYYRIQWEGSSNSNSNTVMNEPKSTATSHSQLRTTLDALGQALQVLSGRKLIADNLNLRHNHHQTSRDSHDRRQLDPAVDMQLFPQCFDHASLQVSSKWQQYGLRDAKPHCEGLLESFWRDSLQVCRDKMLIPQWKWIWTHVTLPLYANVVAAEPAIDQSLAQGRAIVSSCTSFLESFAVSGELLAVHAPPFTLSTLLRARVTACLRAIPRSQAPWLTVQEGVQSCLEIVNYINGEGGEEGAGANIEDKQKNIDGDRGSETLCGAAFQAIRQLYLYFLHYPLQWSETSGVITSKESKSKVDLQFVLDYLRVHLICGAVQQISARLGTPHLPLAEGLSALVLTVEEWLEELEEEEWKRLVQDVYESVWHGLESRGGWRQMAESPLLESLLKGIRLQLLQKVAALRVQVSQGVLQLTGSNADADANVLRSQVDGLCLSLVEDALDMSVQEALTSISDWSVPMTESVLSAVHSCWIIPCEACASETGSTPSTTPARGRGASQRREHWHATPRLKGWLDMLDSSMVEISEKYHHRRFEGIFSNDELCGLIRAVFADNAKRKRLLADISGKESD